MTKLDKKIDQLIEEQIPVREQMQLLATWVIRNAMPGKLDEDYNFEIKEPVPFDVYFRAKSDLAEMFSDTGRKVHGWARNAMLENAKDLGIKNL